MLEFYIGCYIPRAVATLCEPATHCADVLGAAPSTVLPTPCTSSAAGPSNGMGTTLGRGPNLDSIKTPPAGPSERRHVKRRGWYPLQELPCRPLKLPGRRRNLRKTEDDSHDNHHARRHALQCPTVYFLQ